MILLDNLKNKRIGVLGFGQTGKAIVDSLETSGANIFLHDDNGINNVQYKKYCADLLNKEIIKFGLNLIKQSHLLENMALN